MPFARLAALATLALAVLATPLAAEAQTAAKVYTVGTLSLGLPNPVQDWWHPFLEGMSELGYVDAALGAGAGRTK